MVAAASTSTDSNNHATVVAQVSIPSSTLAGATYTVALWSNRQVTCECRGYSRWGRCRHQAAATLPLWQTWQRRRVEQALHRAYLAAVERAGGRAAYERGCEAAEVVRLAQDADLAAWASRQPQYRQGR